MPSIQLVDVGLAPLFSSLSVTLTPGWTALVGPNGAGKTTLLRVIAGEIPPSHGHLRREPRALTALRLSQEAAGAGSAGEAQAARLAPALHDPPDVWLLDEPSNHLDAARRAWLVRQLRRFSGVGVLVSHDRALLDALCHTTIRLHDGRATVYPGGWSAAKAQWAREEAEAIRAASRASDAAKRVERARRDAHANAEAAAAQRNTRARMRSRDDSDARGGLSQGKADFAEAALSRTAGVLRRKADTAAAAYEVPDVLLRRGGEIAWAATESPLPTLLAARGYTLRRGDRVWLRGPNGAGKTTLLHALLDAGPLPPALRVVLPQLSTEADRRADQATLRALPPDARGRVLAMAARLGASPAALVESPSLSPGEGKQLRLALSLASRPALLALDEPTNHLDLPATERLEAALRAWPGALLLVTHDEALARACTDQVWEVG